MGVGVGCVTVDRGGGRGKRGRKRGNEERREDENEERRGDENERERKPMAPKSWTKATETRKTPTLQTH